MMKSLYLALLTLLLTQPSFGASVTMRFLTQSERLAEPILNDMFSDTIEVSQACDEQWADLVTEMLKLSRELNLEPTDSATFFTETLPRTGYRSGGEFRQVKFNTGLVYHGTGKIASRVTDDTESTHGYYTDVYRIETRADFEVKPDGRCEFSNLRIFKHIMPKTYRSLSTGIDG